jgi:hypothetical protein
MPLTASPTSKYGTVHNDFETFTTSQFVSNREPTNTSTQHSNPHSSTLGQVSSLPVEFFEKTENLRAWSAVPFPCAAVWPSRSFVALHLTEGSRCLQGSFNHLAPG